MKRGRISRCPYCGRIVNYFFLYDCKRSDFGYCSHCGGIYLVKYSPLAYLLVISAVAGFAGGFAYWYLANKTMPGATYLLKCALAALVVYFLLPLLIAPRKCIVHGRIGGFPPDRVPAYRPILQRRRRKVAEEQATVSSFYGEDPDSPHISTAENDTESDSEVKIYKSESNSDDKNEKTAAGTRFKP